MHVLRGNDNTSGWVSISGNSSGTFPYHLFIRNGDNSVGASGMQIQCDNADSGTQILRLTSGSNFTPRFVVLSNGNVGVGNINPVYQFQVSNDSAAKPATNTWTISSDERLKTNIQFADLDICYNIIKNLPLKRYTWRDDIYTYGEVPDRSKLGWIAQDVEPYLPKAVEQKEMHGYTDCRTLNSDQIIASLYGAVQKLIKDFEEYKAAHP